ncbi:MAG: hypothetical protein J5710_13735 [Treponema sp.]|nr:hypothetical protein [Treponema sp.]
MNEYVFYTFEGYTESPTGKECKNIQLLGFESGMTKKDAKKNLIEKRNWIKELDFDVNEIESKQLLSYENKQDINTIIEYLWQDEKRNFEEEFSTDNDINIDNLSAYELNKLCPNHILSVLKRLQELINN